MALLLVAAALAGCIGSNEEGQPVFAESTMLRLPTGLAMEDAELVSYNDTTAVWSWTGTVAGETTATPIPVVVETADTTLEVPTAIPFTVEGLLTFAVGQMGFRFIDADGTVRCERHGSPAVVECKTAVRALDASAPWTVEVFPRSTAGEEPFELTLTMTAGIDHGPPATVGAPVADPAPGCHGDRPAEAFHASGRPVDEDALRSVVPCLYRTGAAATETTLGVASNGELYLFSGRASTQPGETPYVSQGLMRSVEGQAWERMPLDLFPAGETEPGYFFPFMHLDPVTDRIFAEVYFSQPAGDHGMISTTDDGGESWSRTMIGGTANYRQSIATGPPVTSELNGYATVAYRCARWLPLAAPAVDHDGVGCHRSLDGGGSWEPTAFIVPSPAERNSCDLVPGDVMVDGDGRLLFPYAWCLEPWLAISEDEGGSWQLQKVSTEPIHLDLSTPRGPAVAVDTAGTVHYGWVASDGAIKLATTEDVGTWEDPLSLQPPGLGAISHLRLAAGAPGNLALAYYGAPVVPLDRSKNVPDGSQPRWDGYITATRDAGTPDPMFLTARINDPATPLLHGSCIERNCQEAHELAGLVIGPDGAPYASFVDGCSAAWTTCEPDDGDWGEGIVAKLWGVDLWDEEGPNGPYPDEAAG